jgi:hypothetical protein
MDSPQTTLFDKFNHLSSNPLLIQATRNAIKERLELEKSDVVLMARRAGIVPKSNRGLCVSAMRPAVV